MKTLLRSTLLFGALLPALHLLARPAEPVTTPPAKSAQLAIQIEGIEETAGRVLFAVYSSPQSFLRKPFRILAMSPDSLLQGPALFSLPSDSVYAVAVFHDTNGNFRHDTNAMGIPTEKYGFSNDAQGVMGPPTFGTCALRLRTDSTILIHLH